MRNRAASSANTPPWRDAARTCAAALVMAAAVLACQAAHAQGTPLRQLRTVVLDPGHGGGNEGALGPGGHQEKDEALRMAVAIRDRLERDYPGLQVVLTRTLDVDLPLSERIHAANALGADLFFSLHLNSSPNPQAAGIEVYFLAADRAMPQVTGGAEGWGQDWGYVPGCLEAEPAPEGAVVGEDLALILGDLEVGRAHRDSAEVAAITLDELLRASGGRTNRGVRQANFGVLRGAQIPAVVVELGFLSNAAEERWLTLPTTRERVARAFSRALGRIDALFVEREAR